MYFESTCNLKHVDPFNGRQLCQDATATSQVYTDTARVMSEREYLNRQAAVAWPNGYHSKTEFQFSSFQDTSPAIL